MSNESSNAAGGTEDKGIAEDADRAASRERRGPPPNPLYHPLFLPVLLVGFSLWFFWDGFVTTDPEMLEHQTFNRVCFGITALLCLRVVPRGIREFREFREEKEAAAATQDRGNPVS